VVYHLGVGVLIAVVGAGSVALLAGATKPSFGTAVLLLTVAFTVGVLAFGPIAAYMTERFPAALRSAGYGIGHSLALVIPAFYAYYLRRPRPDRHPDLRLGRADGHRRGARRHRRHNRPGDPRRRHAGRRLMPVAAPWI
jgi:hypothetical protein